MKKLKFVLFNLIATVAYIAVFGFYFYNVAIMK